MADEVVIRIRGIRNQFGEQICMTGSIST